MRYYPINLDIQGKPCLVYGGGRVAERKVARLLECGAEVTVVAPEVTGRLAELAEGGRIQHVRQSFDADYIEEAFLVIGATDDESVNAAVAEECEDWGVLCNIADDPERCTFTLPAVVARGEFCLAISTGGKSPALAKRVRLELERLYGEEYAAFVDLLGKIRDRLLAEEGLAEAERAARFERLAGPELARLLKAGDTAAADAFLRQVLGPGWSLTELTGQPQTEPEEPDDEEEEDNDD